MKRKANQLMNYNSLNQKLLSSIKVQNVIEQLSFHFLHHQKCFEITKLKKIFTFLSFYSNCINGIYLSIEKKIGIKTVNENLPRGKTRVPKNDRHKIHVILRIATQPFTVNRTQIERNE